MITALFFFLTVSGPPAAPPAAPLALVQEEEKADKRPEIAALLKTLSGQVKKRGDQDEEAIATIDQLVVEWPQCGPKDRAAIAKAVSACLKAKRKDFDSGEPNDFLHLAAATALGRMGPESVKALLGWIGHKTLRQNLPLQARLIASLGKTKDPAGVKPLVDLLKSKDPEVQAAAASALSEYSEIELKTRKMIFEEQLKILMGVKSTVDTDTTDPIARNRWNIISGPIVASLQKLAGMTINDPAEWQRWWNKNKKEDWDRETG